MLKDSLIHKLQRLLEYRRVAPPTLWCSLEIRVIKVGRLARWVMKPITFTQLKKISACTLLLLNSRYSLVYIV